MPGRLVVGAALGDCVHVAGVLNFLTAARRHGYHSEFLGPAVPVAEVVAAAAKRRPDLLALSYRLSPEAAERLFSQLAAALAAAGLDAQRMVFGGTPTVVEVADRSGLFEATFGKPDGPTVEDYLEGRVHPTRGTDLVGDAPPSAEPGWSPTPAPPPLRVPDCRGLWTGSLESPKPRWWTSSPSVPIKTPKSTSFTPRRMDPAQDGAGGVPVRSADDFRQLYEASRRGNHPLMRCYAGTNDQLRFAATLRRHDRQCLGAVPVFWYSDLDRRSQRTLETAIDEQQVVAWSAARGIPVERNDQNQWGLRYAHDIVQVAAAALAAHLTPSRRDLRPADDAQHTAGHLPRHGRRQDGRHGHRGPPLRRRDVLFAETRAGLFSLPPDPDRARGQLASSTRTAMLLAPDIVHVVGYTEAHHAVEADELIASCTLVHQVIDDALLGLPDPFTDPKIATRRDALVHEAELLLATIDQHLPGAYDGDPDALAQIVRQGYFDAPHLAGNPAARGTAVTVVDGGCHTVDPLTGGRLPERDRLNSVGSWVPRPGRPSRLRPERGVPPDDTEVPWHTRPPTRPRDVRHHERSHLRPGCGLP